MELECVCTCMHAHVCVYVCTLCTHACARVHTCMCVFLESYFAPHTGLKLTMEHRLDFGFAKPPALTSQVMEVE